MPRPKRSPATSVLLLTRRDVAALLTPEAAFAAVEQAFRLHAQGRTLPPGVLGVHATDGGFHLKAAGLKLDRAYFAVKCNANFPLNPRRHGLPTIQGLVLLADAENGRPLAVLDSMEITALRTAAATAVAAKLLARPASRRLFLAGCGLQGLYHLRALARVLPLEQVTLFDTNAAQARRLARRFGRTPRLKLSIAGRKPGRRTPEEIIVFDSTGTALEDVAAAVAVYQAAVRRRRGRRINFAA